MMIIFLLIFLVLNIFLLFRFAFHLPAIDIVITSLAGIYLFKVNSRARCFQMLDEDARPCQALDDWYDKHPTERCFSSENLLKVIELALMCHSGM